MRLRSFADVGPRHLLQTGDVDFDKSLDVWQQDKWNGQFKVQWHFVKVSRAEVLENRTALFACFLPLTRSRFLLCQ